MRRGVTLVEMMAVIVVLGFIGSMSVLAVGRLRTPAEPGRADIWRSARARAVRSGRAVSVAGDSGRVVRFLPDGRGLGDGVDLFTGEPLRATLRPTR